MIKIEEMNLADLVLYDKNPRNNQKAVPLVANSIKEFGFKNPIIIDKKNVIICGHTRYAAAQSLGMRIVPCIRADDLTQQQIKAFRLADNKVSEAASWDAGLLALEMNDILDFDMTDFGFEVIDPVEPEPVEVEKENERERTMNTYNLHDFDESRAEGYYQIPTLDRVVVRPEHLIGFNYVKSTPPVDKAGVHFFLDDYQFERIWNNPHDYATILAEWDCVLTPDFSLYLDMPIAMMIWNIYRSRLVGQIMQDLGCTVIPTVSWGDSRTFDFAFLGIPKGGTIAISTIGVKRDDEAFKVWTEGMTAAIESCEPRNIIVYGGDVGYDYKGLEVSYIDNAVTKRMSKRGELDED